MEDLDVLPDELRQQSISVHEIILPFEAALQALELLEKAQWALLGWEGIFRVRKTGHIYLPQDYQGTVCLNRHDGELWTDYVKRTADFCRLTIKQDQQRFLQDSERFEKELYFCLTAIDSAN